VSGATRGGFEVTGLKRQLLRVCLWTALLVGVAAVVWCLNLVLFHLWAAYAPPQQTALHLHWARWCAVALAIALALVGCTGRLIYAGWPREVSDAIHPRVP
jgi:hypothetical protein